MAAAVGAVVMGAELAAGRLLAPYLGTSTLVWSLLIGAVLSFLALGQLWGGRLSRGGAPLRRLALVLLGSAAWLALLPFLGPWLLRSSQSLFRSGAMMSLAVSGLGSTVLVAIPMLGLGAAGPLLIHQAVQAGHSTGPVAGRLYASGSLGSLLGTYATGLLLIPLLGTARTFWACAALLLMLGLTVLLHRPLHRALAALAALLCAAPILILLPAPSLHARPGLIHESETLHNYVQVVDNGRERRLLLNDGYAVQSYASNDGALPLWSVWGYYATAPSYTSGGTPARVLLLGLGGGTAAVLYRALYPQAAITGVELDSGVVRAGQQFLGMPRDITVVSDDARAFVTRDLHSYDVIVVDAFQFPYVPFQLCTQEFFALLDARLSPGGVLMLNVGRDGTSREVVESIARTAHARFATLRGVDVGRSNTILVATRHPADRDAGLGRLGLPERIERRLQSLDPVKPWEIRADALVLTDDRAPVELLTDRILLRRIWPALGGGDSG